MTELSRDDADSAERSLDWINKTRAINKLLEHCDYFTGLTSENA
jgi:hypothetical protein